MIARHVSQYARVTRQWPAPQQSAQAPACQRLDHAKCQQGETKPCDSNKTERPRRLERGRLRLRPDEAQDGDGEQYLRAEHDVAVKEVRQRQQRSPLPEETGVRISPGTSDQVAPPRQ